MNAAVLDETPVPPIVFSAAERRTGPGDASADPLADLFHQRAMTALAAFYDQLSEDLRRRLSALVRKPAGLLTADLFEAAQDVLLTYIDPLTLILTDAQLAAYLGGAGGVAQMLPAQPPPSVSAAAPRTPVPTEDPTAKLDIFESVVQAQKARPEEEWARQKARPEATEGPPAEPPGEPPTISGDWEWPGMRVWLPLVEEGVQDLKSRNLVTREEFDELAAEARQEAFTVAYQKSTQALEKIHEAVIDATAQGKGAHAFTDQVDEALGTSTLGPGHMENVLRTNVQTGYSRGMDKVLEHPLVTDAFPYEEVLPIRDTRLTTLCQAVAKSGIQGTGIYRRDDPVYQRYKSPRHWQDRCGRRALTIQEAAERGIREAQEWLKTGVPPTQPAWVTEPELDAEAWQLFESFRR